MSKHLLGYLVELAVLIVALPLCMAGLGLVTIVIVLCVLALAAGEFTLFGLFLMILFGPMMLVLMGMAGFGVYGISSALFKRLSRAGEVCSRTPHAQSPRHTRRPTS